MTNRQAINEGLAEHDAILDDLDEAENEAYMASLGCPGCGSTRDFTYPGMCGDCKPEPNVAKAADLTAKEAMEKIAATSRKNWEQGPRTIDGVDFYLVGRNASHMFYVGLVGEAFLVLSEGEDYDDGRGPQQHTKAYQSANELIECAYLGHL